MYSDISVDQETVAIHVYSGMGTGPHITMVAATFPIVPAGTIVDKVSARVPGGLQSIAFFCRVTEPQRKGSGKTVYLDHSPQTSTSVLLSWEEGGKRIMKADNNMSATELSRFNPFVRSTTSILVVDPEHKIAYVSDLGPYMAADPTWTYKVVSMQVTLEYITKKLTMEELDERAGVEQQRRDDLQDRNATIRFLEGSVNYLTAQVSRLSDSLELSEKEYTVVRAAHNALIEKLTEPAGPYMLLKRLPANLMPKAFSGFIKAVDSLNARRSAVVA